MLTEKSYLQLIEITNKLEVTVSEYIRNLVVKKIQEEMETKRNG